MKTFLMALALFAGIGCDKCCSDSSDCCKAVRAKCVCVNCGKRCPCGEGKPCTCGDKCLCKPCPGRK